LACPTAGDRNTYPYTAHLLALERRKPQGERRVPPEWSRVWTPMVRDEWEQHLRGHPDRLFVEYLLRGMQDGFRVGFHYGLLSCSSAGANMKSASDNPSVIDEYLDKEVKLGRVLGPLEPNLHPQVHINRFGVIPKKHQPGRWRLIVDLSHPKGASVNDGIEPELCTLHYTSVDEAVRKVLGWGRGTMLAKFDVESAYRTIPVHPDDRWLLGMRWKDRLYIDMSLPFGLRSAPKIYNAVADALQWILEAAGIKVMHYLDDFLIFGAPGTGQGSQALNLALELCRRLGVPVASQKTEGPATSWFFLVLNWTPVRCLYAYQHRSLKGYRERLGGG